VACVLLFSCLSISRLDHYLVELVRNFPAQYLLIGIISLFWSIVQKDKRLILLSPLVVGLNYVQIRNFPLKLFRCCEPASEDSFRVLSVNVLTSSTMKGELLESVKEHSPDVITFLEVNSGWLSEIEERMGPEYPFHIDVPRPDNFGIALRSKFPILKFSNNALGVGQPESIVAELLIGDRSVRIIATHPVPPMSSSGNSLNNQQLKSVTDVALESSLPKIVMGDLNSVPWGLGLKNLIAKAELVDPREEYGLLPTWPADRFKKKFFSIPIDHILVSKDFKVLNLQVDIAPGSDHKMIMADLK
jgi:endonuclease/exonuclease/phosphatase (EEP) superfamily protein YafD